MFEVRLPWPPKELSPNARLHWATVYRAKKAYRRACRMQTILQGAPIIKAPPNIRVDITFYPPTRRRHDTDNCVARIKAGIDGVASAIGVDDALWDMHFHMAHEPLGLVVMAISRARGEE